MNMEKPKTPEEIAAIEKSRALSDAELLKDGAEYVINKEGDKILDVTKNERIHIHDYVNELNKMRECADHKARVRTLLNNAIMEWEEYNAKRKRPHQGYMELTVAYLNLNSGVISKKEYYFGGSLEIEEGEGMSKGHFFLSGNDNYKIPIENVIAIHR